jgi:hypothetical protein
MPVANRQHGPRSPKNYGSTIAGKAAAARTPISGEFIRLFGSLAEARLKTLLPMYFSLVSTC